jgi:PPP family 3-phenylpropionic acid transporter
MLVLISVLQAAALAPITTLADAIALAVALPHGSTTRFEYGWARGGGSAAFIIGALLSGQAVSAWGLPSIVVSHAVLLLAAAYAGMLVPEPARHERLTVPATHPQPGNVLELLSLRPLRYVVLISALVLGSHAMHDAFAVIRWSAAGVTPAMASVLWSESVAAEVIVFLWIGPFMLQRLKPTTALTIAALVGIVRWSVLAQTGAVPALALVEPLHGFTFALFHLACMRLIAQTVPSSLAGTAQALYGVVGIGGATALLTIASGWLYAASARMAFSQWRDFALQRSRRLPACIGRFLFHHTEIFRKTAGKPPKGQSAAIACRNLAAPSRLSNPLGRRIMGGVE